jgi:hypothetical protein
MYLFIFYLTNIIPLIEYAQRREDQLIPKGSIIPKHYIIIFIYLYHYYIFFIQILGFTNPTPLNRNLVLEICKKWDTKGLVCNSAFSL